MPTFSRHHPPKTLGTTIHISALDGLVHVNSIFTFAVFLGLTWNPYDPTNSLIVDPTCLPSTNTNTTTTLLSTNLVTFHVYSFSCFLFSSIIAMGLKQALRISAHYESYRAFAHATALRAGMLLSAVGSACGSVFLMLALVQVVEIKLGRLACGSSQSFAAVVPLLSLVPTGLIVYVGFVLYAFTR
ncbi:hypothetical protein vseg_002430 [Gypsophila vaccaria]